MQVNIFPQTNSYFKINKRHSCNLAHFTGKTFALDVTKKIQFCMTSLGIEGGSTKKSLSLNKVLSGLKDILSRTSYSKPKIIACEL